MSSLQWLLLAFLLGFVLLFVRSPRRPKAALKYLRVGVLLGASVAVLAPFAWLVAAAFKDRAYLNEYVFFPPLSEWSQKTLNLDNFRTLLAGDPTISGTSYFWQYVLNSVFLATATTLEPAPARAPDSKSLPSFPPSC